MNKLNKSLVYSFILLFSIGLMSISLNARDTDENYIIPDLQAWNSVKVGMSTAQLEKLLGQSIKKLEPYGEDDTNTYYPWTYGYVAKKSEIFPEDFAFIVYVQKGKVILKEDPFGGVAVSSNGIPTVPKLASPPNATKFDHYPRFVDFRWYASSGDYPMKYGIQIDVLYPSGKWSQDEESHEVAIPYYSYSHPGTNRGRWRVRALNSKGKSDWSQYYYFAFKQ